MRYLSIIAVILFLLSSIPALAQSNYQIKGTVIDTAVNVGLTNASITVLNAADSILVKFNRSTKDGTFELTDLPKGAFILLVTYPDYADYVERFTLDSLNQSYDFGNLNLILKERLLSEVIITGGIAAIKLKGDTTEYDARAFVIQPNAKVEDLLKQLPGIQVDQNGKITAHGETVRKVLVDGEEFFGDDPTLITRNLRGDMVDKVQLYDKKSDQATFTGVDDGKRIKTINIQLKDDKKEGYFGKIDAGAGTDGFYKGQAMANLFQEKQKVAAYTNIANNGIIGLNYDDASKYAPSGGGVTFLNGGVMVDIGNLGSQYNGQGIPLGRSGGVHYDSKWNDGKELINTNFKIGSLAIDGERNTISQNTLPSGILNSNSEEQFHNLTTNKTMDATYQVTPDSTSTFKITVNGMLGNGGESNNYLAFTMGADNLLLNRSNRTLNNNNDQQRFKADALYNKRLGKPGRTVSIYLAQSLNRVQTEGYLNSTSEFFDQQGQQDSIQNIDQFKPATSQSNIFSSNITYSESLSKSLSLVLNYGLGINKESFLRESFNKSASGRYDELISEFSSDLLLNQYSNQGGATLTYKKDKQTLQLGTKTTAVNLNQIDQYTNTTYKRNFLSWNPRVDYRYQFSPQKRFILYYSGSTVQPGIEQLQPIRTNTDPLNITIGNPDLDPVFRNNFEVEYYTYKVLNSRNISLRGSYSITANPIVNSLMTDAAGKTTYRSINLPGKNQKLLFFSGSYGIRIKSLDAYFGLNTRFMGNSDYGFANGEINHRSSQAYSGNLYVSKSKLEKYNLLISAGPTYTKSVSSSPYQLDNSGRGFESSLQLAIYLPGKLEFRSDARYNFQAKTDAFNQDLETIIINSSLAKKFLEKENLKLAISVNDLLNRNVPFNRSTSGTTIIQNSYITIPRYFMLSLTWDFDKFGKIL